MLIILFLGVAGFFSYRIAKITRFRWEFSVCAGFVGITLGFLIAVMVGRGLANYEFSRPIILEKFCLPGIEASVVLVSGYREKYYLISDAEEHKVSMLRGTVKIVEEDRSDTMLVRYQVKLIPWYWLVGAFMPEHGNILHITRGQLFATPYSTD